MATDVSRQLGRINANARHALDLKAQRRLHSQSLIYKREAAASQDFETLYEACIGGYIELCRQDARLESAGQYLFDDKSRDRDRSQLTQKENRELDRHIERFLRLLGDRAGQDESLQALEWLIRRYRIHEHNSVSLVLSLLQYHTTIIFVECCTLLPKALPTPLKFLFPYIQQQAPIPRHTIIHTAAHNRQFLDALNTHVIQSCREHAPIPHLISFWTTTYCEAIAQMSMQARSGKLEARRQHQEDLLLLVLPTLNDTLSIPSNKDIQIASYVVLAVLIGKCPLQDSVYQTMMEAIIVNWRLCLKDGFLAIAMLADRMRKPTIPPKVLHTMADLDAKLLQECKSFFLASSQKFLIAVAHGIENLDHAMKNPTIDRLALEIRDLASVTESGHVGLDLDSSKSSRSERSSSNAAPLTMKEKSPRLSHDREPHVGKTSNGQKDDSHAETVTSMSSAQSDDLGEPLSSSINTSRLTALLAEVPPMVSPSGSFLAESSTETYEAMASILEASINSDELLTKFWQAPEVRHENHSTIRFVSFVARAWSSCSSTHVREHCIRRATDTVKHSTCLYDLQILTFYALVPLSDEDSTIRRAAQMLVLTIYQAFNTLPKHSHTPKEADIYGLSDSMKTALTLTFDETKQLLEIVLLPFLENLAADASHLSKRISAVLSSSKSSKRSSDANSSERSLRSSTRRNIFTFLCNHSVLTSSMTTKCRVIDILCHISKVKGQHRTSNLLPLYSQPWTRDEVPAMKMCEREGISSQELYATVARSISLEDPSATNLLQGMISAYTRTNSARFLRPCLEEMPRQWRRLAEQDALTLAKHCLDEALEVTGRPDLRKSFLVELFLDLPLQPSVIKSLLQAVPNLSAYPGPSAAKRRRLDSNAIDVHPDQELALRRLSYIIQSLEYNINESYMDLLPRLHTVLSELQEQRVIFGQALGPLELGLINCISTLFQESTRIKPSLEEAQIDSLVRCVQSTKNPQVRNAAFLVLSKIARMFPDQMLHDIMPIFIQMGTSTLKSEDAYTFYIIKQCIDAIVPAFLQSKDSRESLKRASELILAFVSAYPHVPAGHRLTIFFSLLQSIGPERHLFAFIAIMLRNHSKDPGVVRFLIDILTRFEPSVILMTLSRYLALLLNIWDGQLLACEIFGDDQIPNPGELTAQLLPVVPALKSSQAILSRLDTAAQAHREDREENGFNLMRQFKDILSQAHHLQNVTNSSEEVGHLVVDMTDSLLEMLPVSFVFDCVKDLLQKSDHDSIQCLLSTLNRQMQGRLESREATQSSIRLLPSLRQLLGESAHPEGQVAAVIAIDRILEGLGKHNVEQTIECAEDLLQDACLQSPASDLQIEIFLCLATIVEELRDSFVPFIPRSLAHALGKLECVDILSGEDQELIEAIYAFISALISYLPTMVGEKNLGQITLSIYRVASGREDEQLAETGKQLSTLIAKRCGASKCVMMHTNVWEETVKLGAKALLSCFGNLQEMLKSQSKTSIRGVADTLMSLVIKAFDLQFAVDCGLNASDLKSIEDSAIESAISMVYSLNDATFGSIFAKLKSWALTGSQGGYTKQQIGRRTTWYKFMSQFFGLLKSIVLHYAPDVVSEAAHLMIELDFSRADSHDLWKFMIATLHKICEHDQNGHLQNPTNFGPMSAALIGSLRYAISSLPIESQLIPAIVQLAVAADSPTHSQTINSRLTKFLRSDEAPIRLVAIQCQSSLTQRLREEWLSMLPEMLPLISELQEDDDEKVEQATLRWIRQIEDVLGESLEPMLQ